MPHFWCLHCLWRACSHPQRTHLRTVFGLKKKAFCSVIKCIWLLSACVLLNRSGAYSAALSDGRVEQRWLLAQNLLFVFFSSGASVWVSVGGCHPCSRVTLRQSSARRYLVSSQLRWAHTVQKGSVMLLPGYRLHSADWSTCLLIFRFCWQISF